MKKSIIITISATLLLAIALSVYLLIGCQKNVEPINSANISILINELHDAESKEDIEIAITNIFDKIGIGEDVQGSLYSDYELTTDQIIELSEIQSEYKKGNAYDKTIEEIYYRLKLFSDSISKLTNNYWLLSGNLEETLIELQSSAQMALKNVDDPNNSLLMIIYSKDGQILDDIVVYDSTTVLSPIQFFLFYLWTYETFGKTLKSAQMTGCQTACLAGGAVCCGLCAISILGTPICCAACAEAAWLCFSTCPLHEGGSLN
jgi:hypothetical protein